ncbi:MAG: enoyl-CoA hydratase/isomerase family protein [Kiloniellales bacterium]
MADRPFETIRVEYNGAVAVIALDRPDKLNAINAAMMNELLAALDAAERDERVRAIVVQGTGRAFSAGFEIGTLDRSSTASVRDGLAADLAFIMRFWDCPKPTLAAVHGYCLGGAFELALACDVTVASSDALFGEPELKFGSGIVALLLPWLTGPKQAKQILFAGLDRIPAERAQAIGLVNEVVEPGAQLEAGLALARRMATVDQNALRLTKQAVNRSYEIMGLRQALQEALEIDVQIETTETPESTEFRTILKRDGLKAALAWHEARFGKANESE